MSDKKFEEGCKVKLKSGGPVMTVRKYLETDENSVYYCIWFDNDMKFNHNNFMEYELYLVE